jgi:hypothetical protein
MILKSEVSFLILSFGYDKIFSKVTKSNNGIDCSSNKRKFVETMPIDFSK